MLEQFLGPETFRDGLDIDADGFGVDGLGDGAEFKGHHTASVGAHKVMPETTMPPRTVDAVRRALVCNAAMPVLARIDKEPPYLPRRREVERMKG